MDHSLGKDLPNVSVESFENLPGRGLYATLSSIEVISCIFLIGKLIPPKYVIDRLTKFHLFIGIMP